MSDHRVRYGDGDIVFSLTRRNGLKEKVRIHVQPDGRVVVEAPPRSDLAEVKNALLKRASWVNRQLQITGRQLRHVLPRQYVSGETHYYLGKRYLLKVKFALASTPQVKLKSGRLEVTLPEDSRACARDQKRDQIAAELTGWYRIRAQDVFHRRIEIVCRDLPWVQQAPVTGLRQMRKQWGSCSPGGRLSLNPMLVKAPTRCIDYVILHELCHLKHHNHSRDFYRLLKKHLPQWESVKSRLDELSEQILAS